MSGGLDFCVIGAQKAGTSTLFNLLRQHPGIFIPPGKEAPYFSRPDLLPRGLDWFLDEYFRGAGVDQLWGTVTPQYMCHTGTAPLLLEAYPEIRLIAILRDPLERALSHHRMVVARGDDERSATVALAELVDRAQSEKARSSRDESDAYIAWSEYGRLLDEYLRYVDASQLLIVFTEDLSSNPGELVAEIFRFLGLPEYVPDGLGQRYHVGGGGGPVAAFRRAAGRVPILKPLWHRVPARYRDRVWARSTGFGRASTSAAGEEGASESPGLDPGVEARVREHLRPEVERVAELAGGNPWQGW